MSRNPARPPLVRPMLPLLLAALVLAACGSAQTGSAPPAGGAGRGTDGVWMLAAGTSPAGPLVPLDAAPVTLTVQGTAVSGRAACNSYSGEVTAAGGGFRPGSIAVAEMACADPAVSALERRYLDAFAAVTTAAVTTDRLVLTGQGVELTFGRQAPVADAPVEGTRWVLDTIFAGETASTVAGAPFLRLDGNGGLTGNGGCRTLEGRYRLEGETLTVTGLRFVDDAVLDCAREPGAQDDAVRTFLSGPGITAAVTGDRLTLLRGDTGYGFTAGS